jgi:hypothetical protein
MTRMHFTALAWQLRQARPPITEADGSYYQEQQWLCDVAAVADVCAAGNGSFDRGRFLRAAGAELRPDGTMWPMAAPR